MYYLYILECADKTLYTGITTDLKRRVAEHNKNKLGAKYTAARRPVKIVYSKKFQNRSAASQAEARVKKMTRLEKTELVNRKNLKFNHINLWKK
ncbi:MAG: endonuclease [Candidatus Moranbacteria bacterium CG_4_9_14_3_um_filter_42_9]|nr:MAG: endonuclease [Candidatus Moranbacteria bacterium CG_4_9_14_3_um_filter_42_9]